MHGISQKMYFILFGIWIIWTFKYIQLEMLILFIFEKVWNKFKQNFHGFKNISLTSFIWKYLLTKYLGTLFDYILIVIAVNFKWDLLTEAEY